MICRRLPRPAGRDHRPRLRLRQRLEGLPSNGRDQRDPAAGRPAGERPPAPADLHALDQGRAGPRRQHRLRRDGARSSAARSRSAPGRDRRSRCTPSAAEAPSRAGIILADTKFEFGSDARRTARLILIDEVLTPDSSRFWDAVDVRARPRPAELRQAVRARLARDPALGQDATRARASGRGRRRHPRALRRGLRAHHRRVFDRYLDEDVIA